MGGAIAMNRQRWIICRNLAREVRGSEIAEAAMILPLFFMAFMAIFWFGQAYLIYGTLAQGARAGAEAAVAPLCTTCAGAATPALNARAAMYKALASAHLNKNNLVAWGGATPWTPPNLCSCGSLNASCGSSVTCDGTVTDVCVQAKVQLSYPSNGGMGTCGISVSARYKYAYSFRIPLTTLDLNKMLVPGQAQMRAEVQ